VWIIRGIIILIGAIALLWLGTLNAGTAVDFYFFNKTFTGAELNIIIVIAFVAGMIVWAIGAWIREVQLVLRLAKSKRTIERLEREIADLRNIPLEEETGVEGAQ
jgi:uncharacterized membrane protein YciS (DUF1049 family)